MIAAVQERATTGRALPTREELHERCSAPVARVLVAMGVSMTMLLAGGGAVNAAVESDEGSVTGGTVGEALDLPASKTISSTVDQACVTSMNNADLEMTDAEVNDSCRVVTEFVVSKSEEIMLPTGSIWSRRWSQSKTGAGSLWQEKHTGKFYYDGTRVWDTTKYRGYRGEHTCRQGYGRGFSIEVTKCTTYGEASTYRIRIWDYYIVYGAVRGFPISNARNMNLNVYPSGRAYYYWGD